jgi:hypothetical protein
MHCLGYYILFSGKKPEYTMEVDLDMCSFVGHTGDSVWYVLDILYTADRVANIYEEYFTL